MNEEIPKEVKEALTKPFNSNIMLELIKEYGLEQIRLWNIALKP